MTLSSLIRRLQKLEAQGHGRKCVAVNTETLYDGNDTFNVCRIDKAEQEFVATVDGDGFTQFRKDGTERGRSLIVLKGRWWDAQMRQQKKDYAEAQPDLA